MKKICFGFSMCLLILVSACAQTEPTPTPACVQDNVCVAVNPTLKCCTAGKTLQSDPVNCMVAEGTLGGQPMMCK